MNPVAGLVRAASRPAVRGVHPENGDVDPKNGMGLLSSGSRRETVRWKAIAYSYPAH